jgi:CMP-N-acetylneuraminic acid synthetase
MIKGKKVTCFIPAKGGSTRIPDKNIRECDGVPLVRRCVLLARECGFFDNIVVSTDDEDVIGAAGHVVCDRRRASLSQPDSNVWDAVVEYMDTATEDDYLFLLQPTSPCVLPSTIKKICEELVHYEDVCDAIVTTSHANPYSWAAGATPPNFSKVKGTQYMIPRFQLNSVGYIAKWDKLFEAKNIFNLKWLPYWIDDPMEAIDIDDECDLNMAEAVLQWRRNNVKEDK